MSGDVEYMVEQINEKLAGVTIINAAVSNDRESFGFVIKKGKKQGVVWVDRDPEGNGPGWLSME